MIKRALFIAGAAAVFCVMLAITVVVTAWLHALLHEYGWFLQ